MNISGVGATPLPITQPRGEAAEGPGPDHDGDSDDVKAAPAPGTGQVLDKTA